MLLSFLVFLIFSIFSCGVDVAAVMSSGDVAPLAGKAVTQLHEVMLSFVASRDFHLLLSCVGSSDFRFFYLLLSSLALVCCFSCAADV